MAKMQYKIYSTELTPDKNFWLDDITLYLNTLTPTYQGDCQYQKFDLNLTIKLPIPQNKLLEQSIGNYIQFTYETRTWYYFILGATWVSRGAVELVLSIDSVNTFVNELEFTDKTQITRQHMPRFKNLDKYDKTNPIPLIREIDRESEGGVSNQYLESSADIVDNVLPNTDWYLIYRTRDGLTPEDISNPIDCRLCAGEKIKIGATGLPSITVQKNAFLTGEVTYLLYTNSFNGARVVSTIDYTLGQTLQIQNKTCKLMAITIELISNTLSVKYHWYETVNGVYVFNSTSTSASNNSITIYAPLQNGWKTNSINIPTNPDYYYLLNRSDNDPKVQFGLAATLEVSSIESVDLTDSRLMKVIKYPYCPIEITKNGDIYSFPSDWYYELGYLRLKEGKVSTVKFKKNLPSIDLTKYLVVDVEPRTENDPVNSKYESKLYHSDFKTIKLVYDSFSKGIQLENYTKDVPTPIDLYMKATNTINSNFIFNLDFKNFENTEDYQNVLLVNRNNEVPIYSNDYVDYIRNGYNFDKKAKDMSNAAIIFGALTGAGSSANQLVQSGLFGGITKGNILGFASSNEAMNSNADFQKALYQYATKDGGSALDYKLKLGKDDLVRAVQKPSLLSTVSYVATGISFAAGIVQAGLSISQNENQFKSKLQQLSAQSTSVSGADDIDLLQDYSNNRASIKEYGLDERLTRLWSNIFHYAGYYHPYQETPNTTSRYWFNYIQCNPVFKNEETYLFNNYIDDIKARFNNGVTRLHYHSGYNFTQDKENYEVEILSDKIPLGLRSYSVDYNTRTVTIDPETYDGRDYAYELKYMYGGVEQRETFSDDETSKVIGPYIRYTLYIRKKDLRVEANSSLWFQVPEVQ